MISYDIVDHPMIKGLYWVLKYNVDLETFKVDSDILYENTYGKCVTFLSKIEKK